jgi:hypothetical protein
MTFMYQSGEQIRSGDRIEYAGAPGVVEFVVTGASDDPSMNWYIEKFPSGGFMIVTAKHGSIFMSEADEDLDFVSRAGAPERA